MRLGILAGYSGAQAALNIEAIQEADRLGYDIVWTSEAYGSDAVVPLAWIGALTERIYRVSAKSYQPSPRMLESIAPRKQAQVILDSLFATTRADVIRSVEQGLVTFEESADERTVEVSRRGFRLAPEKLSELIEEIGELFARYADLDHSDGLGVAALTVVYPTTRRM